MPIFIATVRVRIDAAHREKAEELAKDLVNAANRYALTDCAKLESVELLPSDHECTFQLTSKFELEPCFHCGKEAPPFPILVPGERV